MLVKFLFILPKSDSLREISKYKSSTTDKVQQIYSSLYC